MQDWITGRDPERADGLVPIGDEKRVPHGLHPCVPRKAGWRPVMFQPMIEPVFHDFRRLGTRSNFAFRHAGERAVFAGSQPSTPRRIKTVSPLVRWRM